MRNHLIFSLLTALFLPVVAIGAGIPSLPGSLGPDPVLRLIGEPGTWTPDNMYEHVNGEAELLKRYGAAGLVNAYYENDHGAYLSADILDMVAPINAFGLYNLYAGCDGEEYSVSGTTVLSGEFTSYAIYDRYFMRIDVDTGEDKGYGRSIVDEFLSELSDSLPEPGKLPLAVERLKELARKPCEVSYHPQHADYDLESGPGYTWTGPGGGIHHVAFLPSPDEAKVHATVLRTRGAPTVLVWGNAVTWPEVRTERTSEYLKKVLRRVVKW